jgi:adenylate cyclase
MRIPKSIYSVSPFKISILVVFVFISLYIANVHLFRFIELKAFDIRMMSRGVIKPGDEVAIVAIDEKSLKEVGRWPWSRAILGELVSILKGYGAKAIGFDVVFSEPDVNSSLKDIRSISQELKATGLYDGRLKRIMDQKTAGADTDSAFAGAIKASEYVTLGFFFHMSDQEVKHIGAKEMESAEQGISGSRYGIVQIKGQPDDTALIRAYSAAANIPVLSASSENSGYFNVFPDKDGVIRWAPLVVGLKDGFYMPLSLSLLLQYLDWPMLSLTISEVGVETVRIGDLDIPTDESGRILVNFAGPPKTFPHYSISDILQGRLSPELFQGKIVIVGATAIGINDIRVTPYSTVYPGTEIHATIIDNILHGNFIRRPGWTALFDLSAIIFVGLFMGIIIPRVKAVQGTVLGTAIIAAYIFLNYLIFVTYSLWLNLVYPVLTGVTAYLGITIYKYVTEEKEKKKIRGAFQYYLTNSVINEMLKDPSKLKLGGDKKDLTVLFSDIRGFTTISEKLSPEELVRLLNEYLTAMTNIVFKYEGLLDKYIGDAIMAVFGAPLDQPDHAERACRTALEMTAELGKLQKKWESEGRPVIRIGVGINTGDMVVGNMGSDMRFDYTVMGDSVNLGARLEGINKEYGTSIVISQYTYERIKDRLFCREIDSVRVKGKHVPVKIYELICDVNNTGDARAWADFMPAYNNGLDLYKKGLWDEAIASFCKALEVRPADSVSGLYISRCNELKNNPPENWDGVFTMTRK